MYEHIEGLATPRFCKFLAFAIAQLSVAPYDLNLHKQIDAGVYIQKELEEVR